MQEKDLILGAEASMSQMVASSSAGSLQSDSVAPFTRTEDAGAAASVTFNSTIASIGPVSPTEDSSEDHAEMDRTSTELSLDSVRLDHDILDTRTEDEAPDLDDDLIPASPVLSERVLSVEATEDTDITTPMEMRDSHTERDASAPSLDLIADENEPEEGKSDLSDKPRCTEVVDIQYLAQEVQEIINRVNLLHERVKQQEIDPTMARSEVRMILDTLEDAREAVGETDDPENMGVNILSNIDSASEKVTWMMDELQLSGPEFSELWSRDEARSGQDGGLLEDVSPFSDQVHPDRSLSDLLDSEDLNRDSLEDEFDRLAADLSLSPSSGAVRFPQRPSNTATPDDLSPPVSPSVASPSSLPPANATRSMPGMKLACGSSPTNVGPPPPH